MDRLPQLFRLQAALEVLAGQTDVLPAVGGATEEELHPDIDEIEDGKITKDDTLLDEPFEFGQSDTYVPLQPLKRTEEHLFRYFQDGSMRSFFAGTALENDCQPSQSERRFPDASGVCSQPRLNSTSLS